MTSTRDLDTIAAQQDLPLELRRLPSTHAGEALRAPASLSGLVAPRGADEIICQAMLRRNLVVPGRCEAMRTAGA